MKRLTLYFITALLLLSGLLGYWWVREYQDRRDQLRREIQSGAREYSLGVMLDLAMNMGEVTTAGDTILRIDIQQTDGIFREAAAGDTLLGFEKMLVSLARRDTFRGEFYQPIREMNPTFSEGSDRMAEELTERFGVTILQLDRQQRAERFSRGDTTMLVQQTLRRRHALDPERPTLSIAGYRRAILLGMLPEFAYGLLLFGATVGALWTARRNLRERDRQLAEKNALVANLAHELKTPIATAGVALEAISHFDADAERRQTYLRIGRGELDRLDRLADRALATLQGDAGGGLYLQKTESDLREILLTAWERLQLADPLPSAQLLCPPAADTTLRADANLLDHLCHNLLDNARKYGPENVRIEAEFERRGDRLRLCLSDNGPGIPPGERDRVFDRFYRVPTAGHAVKGHGLGLAFVRQIARAHGGSIRILDTPSPGATFLLDLPTHA